MRTKFRPSVGRRFGKRYARFVEKLSWGTQTMSQKVDRSVRFWHARIMHGMSILVWLKILAYGRLIIAPKKLGHLITISFTSIFNSMAGLAQNLIYGSKIRATKLPNDPIFVIGHWRSGTTLLHELLILDAQFIYPTTIQTMAPHHFLLTADQVDRAAFLVPTNRPMDDMSAGWHLPQEDEFALLNLGQPSPYRQVVFPDAPVRDGTLSLDGLTQTEKASWTKALDRFLRTVTLQAGAKQLVVKSPTHTARVKTLLALYPNAKFIFIHRDPGAVYGSTQKLWKSLSDTQGLQLSAFEELEARVQSEFTEMMGALERDVVSIPEGNLHVIKYEDLTSAPLAEMERAYAGLGLTGYDDVQPKIAEYFSARADYKVDRYRLSLDQEQIIAQDWQPQMDRILAAAQRPKH